MSPWKTRKAQRGRGEKGDRQTDTQGHFSTFPKPPWWIRGATPAVAAAAAAAADDDDSNRCLSIRRFTHSAHCKSSEFSSQQSEVAVQ